MLKATHKGVSSRLSPKELEQIRKLVKMGFYLNTADFIRSAAREKLSSMEIHSVREVNVEQAKQEILAYLEKHEVAYPSDIAMELGIDLPAVMQAASELWETGKVKEASK